MKKRNIISVLEKLEASKLRGGEKIKGKTATILALGLALAMLVAITPVEAATGDLESTSSTLVVFSLDRDSGYGYWLSTSEANEVVQDKIKPELQNARPSDYETYFNSNPSWYTSQYTFEELIANDLKFHYNYARWDNNIGYNDWYISQSFWD